MHPRVYAGVCLCGPCGVTWGKPGQSVWVNRAAAPVMPPSQMNARSDGLGQAPTGKVAHIWEVSRSYTHVLCRRPGKQSKRWQRRERLGQAGGLPDQNDPVADVCLPDAARVRQNQSTTASLSISQTLKPQSTSVSTSTLVFSNVML